MTLDTQTSENQRSFFLGDPMIRRVGLAWGFFFAGFLSLLLTEKINTWLCRHVAGLCPPYLGACPGIDVCTPDTLRTIQILVFYFGPAVIFGISAFLLSGRHRSIYFWCVFLCGLILGHTALVFLAVQQGAS